MSAEEPRDLSRDMSRDESGNRDGRDRREDSSRHGRDDEFGRRRRSRSRRRSPGRREHRRKRSRSPRHHSRYSRSRSKDRRGSSSRSPSRSRLRRIRERTKNFTDQPVQVYRNHNEGLGSFDSLRRSGAAPEVIRKIQDMMNPNQTTQTSKVDRQLYIGNVPSGIDVPGLMGFLNQKMAALGANMFDGGPIVSAWISGEGRQSRYAFVEFRTIEDANMGFGLNNSMVLGHTLKIGRPRNYATQRAANEGGNAPNDGPQRRELGSHSSGNITYNQADLEKMIQGAPGLSAPTPAVNTVEVRGIPEEFREAEVTELFTLFGQVTSTVFREKGIFFVGYSTYQECEKALAIDSFKGEEFEIAIKEGPQSRPSRAVLLKNMMTTQMLSDREEYEDALLDIKQECESYGPVIELIIPRSEDQKYPEGVGGVFIKFEHKDGASRALKDLSGRKFDGNVIQGQYYSEDHFNAGSLKLNP